MYEKYAVQMGKGWEMLQDVLKHGHESGARGGAGLQCSTTSGQGGPGARGRGEKIGNKRMLGTGRMHQDTENALMHSTSSLP